MCIFCVFLYLFLFLYLFYPPHRHVCEDSVRARPAEGLCQHLSVKLSPAASRPLQRGACGVTSIRRSQRLQSSHEPRRATHRDRQQYVTKARDDFFFFPSPISSGGHVFAAVDKTCQASLWQQMSEMMYPASSGQITLKNFL